MDVQNKRYAIFLDIDGTLLRKSLDALQRNIDVIQKVRSLGHKVLINTGRSTAYMPEEMDVEKYFDGVISGAGARIILDKKEIFCKLMPDTAIRRFCEIWFDNWMAYDELWFKDMNISLEDATIEEIADVTSGGTMKFEFELYDADVQLNSDLTIAENDTTVKTIVVALDKEMKMLGCTTKNLTLKGDKNIASVELELSDDENDANFYGKLENGGQINFYAWNNMQPLCDPIVID